MKKVILGALLVGATALSSLAQGYRDGIEYYKAGQYGNAITILDRNLNDASTDKSMAYYYLGQAYLGRDNDVNKARQYFDKGVAADANNPYNYVGLGALALRAKDVKSATEFFKKATSLAKKNHEITVDIARAYFEADPVAYAAEVDKYVAKARKDSKHSEPTIFILEGDRKFAQRDYNGAATEYEQAITFDEDNPEGYVKYANTYYYVNPQYAIMKLQELLQRRPNSALAQRELAEKFYNNGQWTQAARQYGDYINNPNHFPEDRARYAVLLYAGEHYQESLDIAQEILAQNPNDITLNRIVILDLDRLDRKAEALQQTQKYFNNPTVQGSLNAADFRTYGSLLRSNGQDSLAVAVLTQGLEKFENDAALNLEASDALYAGKDFCGAANYFAKFLANTKQPRKNDYFNGALRHQLASLTQYGKNDTVSAVDFALKGVELMDQALDGIEPPHQYLDRRAHLLVLANNKTPDEKAFADFAAEVALLDLDPTKADPTRKPNYLREYVAAYTNMARYAASQGDIEKAEEYRALAKKYKDLQPADPK